MNRNKVLIQNLPQVFLALAAMAVSLLVFNLVWPINLPVSYSGEKQVSQVVVLNRAQEADAARWEAQGQAYNRQRAQLAYADRLQGQADFYNLQRGRHADIERWNAIAQAYKRQRGRDAYAERLQAQSDWYLKTSLSQTLNKPRQAYADRLTAQAQAFFIKQGGLSKLQVAEAARWTAMALHYGAEPDNISPQLRFILVNWGWMD